MNSEALRAHLADRSALPDAHKALALLNVHVQKNFFGSVEGVDTVHLALDALASPLTRMFKIPLDPAEAPQLVDVLAYLVSRACIEPGVVALLEQVRQGIKRSTYDGLREENINEMEKARCELYDQLTKVLSAAEQEAPDG